MKPKPCLILSLALFAAPLVRADMVADLVARGEGGELAAQVQLAELYTRGEAVPKDDVAAVLWLNKAAEQGDPGAQFLLGQRLLAGDGVEKDTEKGVEWLSSAAVSGNKEAQMFLGTTYLSGKGVKRSSAEAALWFTMSAEAGTPAAQSQLARMHLSGAGVVKDELEAYKWATLAAAGKDPAATRIIEVLEKKFSALQLEEAKSRAEEFATTRNPGGPAMPPPDLPLVPDEVVPSIEPEP